MSRSDVSSSTAGFEYLDHTADVWVHAWGPALEQAFEQCVYGLMETMIENYHSIEENETYQFEIIEETKGSLLIAFLTEFLFLFDTEGLIFHRVALEAIVPLENGHFMLKGTGYGDIFDSQKYIPDTEVKAITYSYLEIKEAEQKTEIKIVYDI
ncbi:Protein archease [Candidatus Lokiarchaeum ossiferum]|uniref:Protein archease n=1 Tax=Candidatus Lokiarchaeum ossiferum TaxID=2951803 RepID=A0ABY6HUX4_9ARCH|nr:Protein archease [Candidatus Lokiarchaeum sp. B-35]